MLEIIRNALAEHPILITLYSMVQTVYPNLRDFCLTSSQVRVTYAALSRTKLSDYVQSIYSLHRRNINILDYQSITASILQW